MPTLTDPDADKRYAPKASNGLEEKFAAPDADQVAAMERQFTAPAATESGSQKLAKRQQLEKQESEPENPMNFTGGSGKENHNPQKRRFWNRKRAGVAGGIAGGVSVVGLLFGTVTTGPLQIMHLSEVLQHSFSKQQSDSTTSEQHWMRSLRAMAKGDYRYTRVGLIGSKMAKGLLSNFEESGITFGGSDIIGHPETIKFNQRQFADATGDESIKSMTQNEFREHIKNTYGVEIDKNNTANLSALKTQDIGKLMKNLRGVIGQDGLVGWLKGRVLNKFYGIKSIFHPVDAAATNKLRRTMTPEEAFENTTDKDLEEPTTKTASAAEDVRNASGSGLVKAANWTTIGQGAVYGLACTMVAGGKAIVVIDRAGTVMPAIVAATKMISLKGQIEAGDAPLDDVGAAVSSLTATTQSDEENGTHDAGTTVWDGGALGVLDGTVTPDKNGRVPNDLTTDRQGAFDPPSAKVLEGTGNALAKMALGPVNVATYLTGNASNPCGLIGTVGLVVEGVGIQLGLAVGAVFSGGTDEVAAQSTSAAIRVAVQNMVKQMVNKVAAAKALGFGVAEGLAMQKIQKVIVDSNAAKTLAASAFRGAQGGDLLAYGARASANLVSASSGGIALAGTTSKTLLGSAGQESQQQFLQQSFFARMFDISDSRSLLGHLSMDINPNFSANITSLSDGMLGIGNSILHSFGSLFSRGTFADTASDSYSGNYDWGFPQYGLPDNLINSDDPSTNAEDLGQYLTQVCPSGPSDGQCGSSGEYGGYTSRIEACFGNDLTHTDGLWDVSPSQAPDPSQPVDIDPGSDNYRNAHCDNDGNITVCSSDSDISPGCIWGRVMLFVNDINTLKAMACATENTSCSDIGVPGGDASSATDGTAFTPGGVSGDAKTLAQQLLSEDGSRVILSTSSKTDLQKTAAGKMAGPGPIGDGSSGLPGCTNPQPTPINATLLQLLLNISAQYKIEVQDMVSGHQCDTGNHPKGRAADIFQINGQSLNDDWWANSNAITVTNHIGQIEHDTDPSNSFGLGVGCTTTNKLSVPSNVVAFGDSCNPQDEIHIDVRGG